MTLFDLLESVKFIPDELTNVLIQLDNCLEYIHAHGFCVFDFDPKKIVLINEKITPNSFKTIMDYSDKYENATKMNIFQASKIGILSYNNIQADGVINQEHFNFIRDNLAKFNQNGNIPKEIFEYYEDIFLNLNVDYLNNYLVKKQQEQVGNSNTNTLHKSLSTDIGRAFSEKNENAFLQVLFIPGLITLAYIITVLMYMFIFN